MGALRGQSFLEDLDVIIDTREHALNPIFKEALERRGLKVGLMKLEEGDFAVPSSGLGCALIERKTVDDLINSVIDERIWSQLARLRAAASKARVEVYLLIEGDVSRTLSNRSVEPLSVMRVLELSQRRYGVTVVLSIDEETTIEWLARKVAERKRELSESSPAELDEAVRRHSIYHVKGARADVRSKIEAVASVLAGRELGLRLLERFGTLRELANASISELKTVRGIGDVRAREIFAIFNKKWEAASRRGDRRGARSAGPEERW
ncbi:MAG: ERCC4 domain-containing protein [Fervidicoccaceae archaeon]